MPNSCILHENRSSWNGNLELSRNCCSVINSVIGPPWITWVFVRTGMTQVPPLYGVTSLQDLKTKLLRVPYKHQEKVGLRLRNGSMARLRLVHKRLGHVASRNAKHGDFFALSVIGFSAGRDDLFTSVCNILTWGSIIAFATRSTLLSSDALQRFHCGRYRRVRRLVLPAAVPVR